MSPITKPSPISGFPEFLPAEQILFSRLLSVIRNGYERNGFSPIETSSVERKEVLTSKGGNEKEIYALSRLATDPGENSETELALHFDLTVPLARYVAMNKDKLTFPFRRYQIQKVWRGERPQAGRYREFYQCDIDVIGRGSLSLLTDAEIPSIIYQIFREMEIGRFLININNRKILQGYFQSLNITTDVMNTVLRIIDKLEKVGTAQVLGELTNKVGIEKSSADKIVNFLERKLDTNALLAELQEMKTMNELFSQGIDELVTVIEGVRSLGVPEDYFKIDLGIARGLDYYTGTVYETKLVDYPGIGSICSGGRYEDLASFYTEEKLPGVGISIGLTRLVPRLIEAGILKVGPATVAPVLISSMDERYFAEYLKLGSLLRNSNIFTEVYLEKSRLGDQLRYANKKGFQIVIIAGETEIASNSVKVKNLLSGDETTHSIDNLVEAIQSILKAV